MTDKAIQPLASVEDAIDAFVPLVKAKRAKPSEFGAFIRSQPAFAHLAGPTIVQPVVRFIPDESLMKLSSGDTRSMKSQSNDDPLDSKAIYARLNAKVD